MAGTQDIERQITQLTSALQRKQNQVETAKTSYDQDKQKMQGFESQKKEIDQAMSRLNMKMRKDEQELKKEERELDAAQKKVDDLQTELERLAKK